jgi:hypothetical protein
MAFIVAQSSAPRWHARSAEAPDSPAVATSIFEQGGNILESQQLDDTANGRCLGLIVVDHLENRLSCRGFARSLYSAARLLTDATRAIACDRSPSRNGFATCCTSASGVAKMMDIDGQSVLIASARSAPVISGKA